MEYFFLGLGNPTGYEGTRHNVGKDLVEGLVKQAGCLWREVSNGKISVLLLGPHIITCGVSDGFMNETGQDMRSVLSELEPSRLVVVHDEVDFDVGTIRLSEGKSAGGHHGVESIIEVLGTKDFFRLRIGVGKRGNIKQHVLARLPADDMHTIAQTLQDSLPDILIQLFRKNGSTVW